MKRVLKWVRDYLIEILVLLLIVLIVLYIIEFAGFISNKAINFLVASAAVISTFFLFLAFRQNKLSNDLKINEPILNQFEKKVLEKETKSQQLVLMNLNKEEGNPLLPSSIALQWTTYAHFLQPLSSTLKAIQENSIYRELLKLIEESNLPVEINDQKKLDDAIRASLAFRTLREGIRLIVYNYLDIFFLLHSIDESSLHEKQKSYLVNRLDKLLRDFYFFFKSQDNVSSSDYLLTQYIKEFKWFDITTQDELISCTTSFDNLSLGFDFTQIVEKYKE